MRKEALYTIGGNGFVSGRSGYIDGEFIVKRNGSVIGYCNESCGDVYLGTYVIIGKQDNDKHLDFYMLNAESLYDDEYPTAYSCNDIGDIDDSRHDLLCWRITPDSCYTENSRKYRQYIFLTCKKLEYFKKVSAKVMDSVSILINNDADAYLKKFISRFDSLDPLDLEHAKHIIIEDPTDEIEY